MAQQVSYKPDCRHFRGDIPCRPHKREGVHCGDCPHFEATDRNILIIKLGAIGDVLRTTPLLERLKAEYPGARIWWLTHTPEVLPSQVDIKLKFDIASVISVLAVNFDLVLNLDKDREACAIADRLEASVKKGFTIRNGICAPVDADAQHKFNTGIFDDVNQKNTRHYVDEIFEVCGFDWRGEEYILEVDTPFDIAGVMAQHGLTHNPDTPIIGLNTGCGGRWTSRLWAEERWIRLADLLAERGYLPLFLGGAQEDEKNTRLAAASSGVYLGHYPLDAFIAEMDCCQGIVTAVTMAMHIAIGLRKQLFLFNNIFNRNEFELYGRGEIIEPDRPCTCFFLPTCTNEEYSCMEHIAPERVADPVSRSVPAGAALR